MAVSSHVLLNYLCLLMVSSYSTMAPISISYSLSQAKSIFFVNPNSTNVEWPMTYNEVILTLISDFFTIMLTYLNNSWLFTFHFNFSPVNSGSFKGIFPRDTCPKGDVQQYVCSSRSCRYYALIHFIFSENGQMIDGWVGWINRQITLL